MLYLSMTKPEYHLAKKVIVTFQEKYYFIAPDNLLKKNFKQSDHIILYSLSNLGDSLPDIKKNLEQLSIASPTIKILSMNLEFDTISFPYLLNIVKELSVMEEEKKQLRLIKQKKGIQKAKESGKQIGRPQIPYPENWNELYNAWLQQTLRVQDILSQTHLKKSTFYHLIHRYEADYDTAH